MSADPVRLAAHSLSDKRWLIDHRDRCADGECYRDSVEVEDMSAERHCWLDIVPLLNTSIVAGSRHIHLWASL